MYIYICIYIYIYIYISLYAVPCTPWVGREITLKEMDPDSGALSFGDVRLSRCVSAHWALWKPAAADARQSLASRLACRRLLCCTAPRWRARAVSGWISQGHYLDIRIRMLYDGRDMYDYIYIYIYILIIVHNTCVINGYLCI